MTTAQPTPVSPSGSTTLKAPRGSPGATRRRRRLPLWADALVVVAFVGLLLYLHTRVVRVCYVPSESMAPTLEVGDRVLVHMGAYRRQHPRRGDIVLLRAPKRSGFEVKRVIATGGDTLVIVLGLVFRDSRRLVEPYIAEPMGLDLAREVRLHPGQLWVMGDNRNHSEDSRDWGPLDEDEVVGRLCYRVWPPRRVGRLGPPATRASSSGG